MTERQDKILDTAIEKFGTLQQLDMVIEESAELIQAINKMKRAVDIKLYGHIPAPKQHAPHPSPNTNLKYSLTYFGLCSEVADVKIMLHQIEKMLDKEAIQISVDRKIDRLEERLNKKTY